MSTTPTNQQQQPPPLTYNYNQPPSPPMAMIQQANAAHTRHGSVGAAIAVVAVITILGVIAVMIGRLCSGRTIMGHGLNYDFEACLGTKCSSCIDGGVDILAPQLPRSVAAAGEETEAVEAEEDGMQEKMNVQGHSISDQASSSRRVDSS